MILRIRKTRTSSKVRTIKKNNKSSNHKSRRISQAKKHRKRGKVILKR